MPVILGSGYFFGYSKEGTNALVFDAEPTKPLTVSGCAREGKTEDLLEGTSYWIDESMGRRRIIVYAELPFFRGLLRPTGRPCFNSILFSGVFWAFGKTALKKEHGRLAVLRIEKLCSRLRRGTVTILR